MPRVIPERMTARVDGDFVVFLICMRINRLRDWLEAIGGAEAQER